MLQATCCQLLPWCKAALTNIGQKQYRTKLGRTVINRNGNFLFKLPNGLYDDNALDNYIQEYFLTSVSPQDSLRGSFETPPFYFDVNYATNRFMLTIRGVDYEIDFSHGNILVPT
jgi:hypothetical protein